jgi:hypothetical protein
MTVMAAVAPLLMANAAAAGTDISPAWPPQLSQWAVTGGDWLFNTSNESEWTPPPNLRDANLAFYTPHALTSFSASYEWRWPYRGSDGWGEYCVGTHRQLTRVSTSLP